MQKAIVEVFDGEPEDCGNLRSIVEGAKGWVVLTHGGVDALLWRDGWIEADRNRPDGQVECNGLRTAQDGVIPIKPTGGAKRGMSRKLQFFRDGEDTDLHTAGGFDRGVARQDEGGLTEVGLPGERLHLLRRESANIGEDGERVAFKSTFGEDIDVCKVEAARSLGFSGRGWWEGWMEQGRRI